MICRQSCSSEINVCRVNHSRNQKDNEEVEEVKEVKEVEKVEEVKLGRG